MLKVDYMHIAEDVLVDPKGRHSIINIAGRVDIPQVPARLANVKITAGIRAIDEPYVGKPLKIKLVMRGGGQKITLLEVTQKQPIEVGFSSTPIFDINGLVFHKFDNYTFELYINNEKKADSLLMIKDSSELTER